MTKGVNPKDQFRKRRMLHTPVSFSSSSGVRMNPAYQGGIDDDDDRNRFTGSYRKSGARCRPPDAASPRSTFDGCDPSSAGADALLAIADQIAVAPMSMAEIDGEVKATRKQRMDYPR
jgi:hypothetical protein